MHAEETANVAITATNKLFLKAASNQKALDQSRAFCHRFFFIASNTVSTIAATARIPIIENLAMSALVILSRQK